MNGFWPALASAGGFAVATVAQHRSAQGQPDAGTLRSLGRLLRSPLWLAGQLAGGLGLLLHAVALRGGSVVVVQPVLAAGLPLALALGALVDLRDPARPLPRPRQWVAAVLAAAGLALFLLAASPTAGTTAAHPVPLAGAVAGGLLLCALAAARRGRSGGPARWRSAVAAGAGFGVTGLLLKEVAGAVPGGAVWWGSLAALLVLGTGCVLAAQRTYAAGALVHTLPLMTVLEPLVAVLLAGVVFGEHLATGAAATCGQVLGAALMAAGVGLLARATAPEAPVAAPRPARVLEGALR